MPSRFAVAWAAFALCAAAPAAPTETGRRAASDFHRLAEVESTEPFARGAAYAVALEAEAVEALREGGELRLFDAAGREVPSLVHTAVARQQTLKRPVTIFNQTWKRTGASVVQTLSVELTDRNPAAVNEFVFEIGEDRYNASVLVEGSEDGESWRSLRDGLYLIRHAVKGDAIRYAHDELRIPTARFRRYRFTLTLPGRERPLDVKSVSVREEVTRGASLALPAVLERWRNDRDPDPRHDYWKLDLGRESLGVDRVEFGVDAVNYARGVCLWEWSEELGRPGRRLASGVAFQYGDERQTALRDFSTDARVLVLMIDQGDDEPVVVTAARASRPRQQLRFLVEGSPQPPLGLYVQPDAPRTPHYDLPRRLREQEIHSFTALAHGPLRDNPAYAEPPKPASEQVPYLLYGVVLVLVIGLAAYIGRTVRAGLPAEPPRSPEGDS